YLKTAGPDTVARYTLSQSLAHVAELGSVVLQNLALPNPEIVRDGLTGYPLQADFAIDEISPADYDAHKSAAQALRPPVEIFGQFNRGLGILRVATETRVRALIARGADGVVAGLSYYFDEQDQCVRLVDSFATDDSAVGPIVLRAIEL